MRIRRHERPTGRDFEGYESSQGFLIEDGADRAEQGGRPLINAINIILAQHGTLRDARAEAVWGL